MLHSFQSPEQFPLIQVPEQQSPEPRAKTAPPSGSEPALRPPAGLRSQPEPLRAPRRTTDTKSLKVSPRKFPYQALLHFPEDHTLFVGIQNQGVQLNLPQADQKRHTLGGWDRSQVASPGKMGRPREGRQWLLWITPEVSV